MNTGDLQSSLIERFKKAIGQAIEVYEVDKGAICIATPFLDWQGAPIKVYVTKDGLVTDGGLTAGYLKALRAFEQFEEWPFRSDFLSRYCISFDGSSMMLDQDDDDCNLLRFAQGVSRLPSYFEPKPIHVSEDRFPERVKNMAVELIMEKHPLDTPEETQALASRLVRARQIPLKNGYIAVSDMSPDKQSRMVQVISHSRTTASDRRSHVQSKLLDPILWKRDYSKGEVYAVLEDIHLYPPDSRRLLNNETQVIEVGSDIGKEQLLEILVSR